VTLQDVTVEDSVGKHRSYTSGNIQLSHLRKTILTTTTFHDHHPNTITRPSDSRHGLCNRRYVASEQRDSQRSQREGGGLAKEKHAAHGELVRDAIIGFADGLTVPFALTAGLSSLGSAKLVILGGLAELFAGSLSMGLGAYLAAVTEAKHYEVEELRERAEVKEKPLAEEDEVYEIFEQYGIERAQSKGVVEGLKANEDMWVRFMMDFELKLEKPRTKMAWIEGIVMAVTYFFGEYCADLQKSSNPS